jgi:hypothetical protein
MGLIIVDVRKYTREAGRMSETAEEPGVKAVE